MVFLFIPGCLFIIKLSVWSLAPRGTEFREQCDRSWVWLAEMFWPLALADPGGASPLLPTSHSSHFMEAINGGRWVAPQGSMQT